MSPIASKIGENVGLRRRPRLDYRGARRGLPGVALLRSNGLIGRVLPGEERAHAARPDLAFWALAQLYVGVGVPGCCRLSLGMLLM